MRGLRAPRSGAGEVSLPIPHHRAHRISARAARCDHYACRLTPQGHGQTADWPPDPQAAAASTSLSGLPARPAVSVVMPFGGSREELHGALAALERMRTKPGDEVILAFNGDLDSSGADLAPHRRQGHRSQRAALVLLRA